MEQPPGRLVRQTWNSFLLFAGTDQQRRGGACASMVATWLHNILCGGTPTSMAVYQVLQEMQEDTWRNVEADPRHIQDYDFREIYHLKPAGLYTIAETSLDVSVPDFTDYIEGMVYVPSTVFCNIFNNERGFSHGIGFSSLNGLFMFFDPNLGVYQLNMMEFQIALPNWMGTEYSNVGYKWADMLEVNLIEPEGRRPSSPGGIRPRNRVPPPGLHRRNAIRRAHR